MGASKFYTFGLILFNLASTLISVFKFYISLRLHKPLFTKQLVSVRFWPKFSVFSASLFAWKVKVSLFYGLEKSQLVLGASRVSMAQGLPKAGEGPALSDKVFYWLKMI